MSLYSLFFATVLSPLIPWSGTQVCDACSPQQPVELCEPHREFEEETIQRFRLPLESETDGERIKALEAIAALTDGHSNAPSPRVAQVLVAQLDAPSMAVQSRAAALLSEGQHGPTVLPALIASLARVDLGIAGMLEELKGLGLNELEIKAVGPYEKVDVDDVRKLLEAAERLQELTVGLETHRALRSSSIKGLGGLLDDRATGALIASAERSGESDYSNVDVYRALLQHGTREALVDVVAFAVRVEKALAEAEKVRRKIKREKPKKRRPKGWVGTTDAWIKRQEKTRDQRCALARDKIDLWESAIRQITRDLATFAKKQGLPEARRSSTKFAAPWKQWLSKNKKALPESLGQIDGADTGTEPSGARLVRPPQAYMRAFQTS